MGPDTLPTHLTLNRHSFLVRIWREGEGGRWQGWAQHVRTGESVTFHSLEELLSYLQRWEEDQGSETGGGLK